MLVLSRKEGEQIQIGDNIVITVVSIGYERIKFGIDAPTEIPILRSELISPKPTPPTANKP